MEKIILTEKLLEDEGSRVLAVGVTTDKILNFYGWGDKDKLLKFVVKKGFINDWCIYLESMDRDTTWEEVEEVGNKISPETAKKLINCSEEIFKRYRL